MWRFLIIVIAFLGASLFESGTAVAPASNTECEIIDLYNEQIRCCRQHNIDIEPTSTIVVPTSVRTLSSSSTRHSEQRMLHLVVAENLGTTTKYPITRFIHRLGSCARAVDFYLYMLCQLRL